MHTCVCHASQELIWSARIRTKIDSELHPHLHGGIERAEYKSYKPDQFKDLYKKTKTKNSKKTMIIHTQGLGLCECCCWHVCAYVKCAYVPFTARTSAHPSRFQQICIRIRYTHLYLHWFNTCIYKHIVMHDVRWAAVKLPQEQHACMHGCTSISYYYYNNGVQYFPYDDVMACSCAHTHTKTSPKISEASTQLSREPGNFG
jgi:hypothetical protein